MPATALKPDAPEGQRRLELAQWITDVKNPLFARVIVNRLWQYHFGAAWLIRPATSASTAAGPAIRSCSTCWPAR